MGLFHPGSFESVCDGGDLHILCEYLNPGRLMWLFIHFTAHWLLTSATAECWTSFSAEARSCIFPDLKSNMIPSRRPGPNRKPAGKTERNAGRREAQRGIPAQNHRTGSEQKQTSCVWESARFPLLPVGAGGRGLTTERPPTGTGGLWPPVTLSAVHRCSFD